MGMVSVCHYYAMSECQAASRISRAFCFPFSSLSLFPPSSLSFSWQLFSTSCPSPSALTLPLPPIHPLFFSSSFNSASLTVCCHFFFPLLHFRFILFFSSLNAFLPPVCLWPLPFSFSYLLSFDPPPNDPLPLFVCFYYCVRVLCRVCGFVFAHAQAGLNE